MALLIQLAAVTEVILSIVSILIFDIRVVLNIERVCER